MNSSIKLMFEGFWHPGEPIQNNAIYRILSKRWNISISTKPDFLIYSWRGREYLKYDCIRIYYTGENIRPPLNDCDYAFSFDYPITERNYRLPLYRLFEQYPRLFQPRDPDRVISENRKFCCFLVSKESALDRIKFFKMLSEYKQVDSGGKVLNNIGYQVSFDEEEKISWMKGYKFSIVFENSAYPGYTTEKLLFALISNTIPIYWGNPLVAKDFNPRAFINCHDFGSFSEVIERVKEVDQRDSLAREYLSQPPFPNNAENDFCREENILERFDHIFTHKEIFVSPAIKKQQKLQYLALRTRQMLGRIKRMAKLK